MKTFLALACVGLLLAGCQSGSEESMYADQRTHTWSTNEGTFAMDHVSNHRVDVSKAIRRTYQGEPYYFESEENAQKFDENPDSYLYDLQSAEHVTPGP